MSDRRFPFYAAITYLYRMSKDSALFHRAVFFVVNDLGSVKIQIEKMKAEIKTENYVYIDGSATVHKIPDNVVAMVTVGDRQEEIEGYKQEYLERKDGKEKSIDSFVEFCKARFCVSTLEIGQSHECHSRDL